MTRRVVAVIVLWAAVIAVLALIFGGPTVASCLGPLGVTPEQCRAMHSLPPETTWDELMAGPAPWLAGLLVGWTAIVGFDRWRKRQRGGL